MARRIHTLGELTDAELEQLAAPAIDSLDDAASTVPELSDALEQTFGAVPYLRIDITDPPTPVVAKALGVEHVGQLGDSVDDVTRELHMLVAGNLRDKRVAAIAKAELKDAPKDGE